MKTTVISAAFLTLLATAGIAQDFASEKAVHYTHASFTPLVRNATTSADYLALRDYYNRQAKTDSVRADEEKLEWQRRSANPAIYAKRYPSPVDSAHYLYEYYLQAAEASSAKAEHYEQLAESSTATK
jgi:hypothetical protein